MERLTYDFGVGGNHCWQIHGADNELCEDVCKRYSEGCKNCPIGHAFDRLAAYEDTGLEPGEIRGLCSMDSRAKMADLLRLEEYQELGSIDRLRELVRAERDGRLVVLPCKVGDTVYAAEAAPVIPLTVDCVGVWLRGADGEDWESIKNFGKTVFLSRKEAEAAMEGVDET